MKKGKKGKKNKKSLTRAYATALEAFAKTLTAPEATKKVLGEKAILANAPALIDAIVNAGDADLALLSTAVKAATVFKSDPAANTEVFNNTIQRYLLLSAKSKKVKKLIKANME